MAKRPIEYATGFTLLPGKHTVKILARDAETGRIGTFQQTYIIPNPDEGREADPNPARVVLSSQKVDLKDTTTTLYNALKDKDQRRKPP